MPRVLVVLGLLYPTHVTVWRAARDLGIDIHIAGALRGPLLERHQPPPRTFEDIPTHALEVVGPRRLTERGLQWWRLGGLTRVRDRIKPDITHVVSEVWGLMAIQGLALGDPAVIHSWDNLYRHGRSVEDALRLAVARRNLGRCAGHASASRRGLELAFVHGFDPHGPTTVAPPVAPDPERFLPRPHIPSDVPTVGFVGRLVPEKGVDWLIRAFGAVEADARLLVYGTGPQYETLASVARSTGRHIEFRGSVSAVEMPQVMASMDVLVVPSRSRPHWQEQYGRVAVEAMMAGTPVVASRSGALPEVVGPGGVLVDEGDVDGLAGAIRDLIGDDRARQELGRLGRAFSLDQHAPGAVARRVARVWREALG